MYRPIEKGANVTSTTKYLSRTLGIRPGVFAAPLAGVVAVAATALLCASSALAATPSFASGTLAASPSFASPVSPLTVSPGKPEIPLEYYEQPLFKGGALSGTTARFRFDL